ncbi:guanylate kinase [bacterium]|nr:guanylate kinase [bacterium]
MRNNIYVLSGPSGVGKSTMAQKLLSNIDNLKRTISYTSRLKRADEVDGVDYHFIHETEFKEMIEKGEFIEWVQVYDNYYGTAFSTLRKMLSETDLLMVIERRGARNIKEHFPENAILTYILPPTFDELKRRLLNRGCNTSKKDIKERLSEAKEEIKSLMSSDSVYDYAVINDKFEGCIENIVSIIKATRCRLGQIKSILEILI